VPAALRRLTVEAARDLVMAQCFAAPEGGAGKGRVGIEYELLSYATADRHGPVDVEALRAATDHVLPGGSRVTFEPGGQLELSGPPCTGVGAAVAAMADDLAAVRTAAAAIGVELVGNGMDALRAPSRIVHSPRYDAMEQHFDHDGPHGRTMMCSTASLQVNIDLGPAEGIEGKWRSAHAVAPVLAAAFANSPVAAGRRTGLRSSRLATWSELERSRTASDGIDAWVDRALDAAVMLVRLAPDRSVAQAPGLTVRQWIADGHPLGWPDADDLAYHLTTLFPPVRPRGWFEVRVIDSLPDPWWRVAAVATTALLDDPAVADEARAATVDLDGLWHVAAADGLANPLLRDAARRCFALVLDAVPRLGVDRVTADACCEFVDRYVARGRCPADDMPALAGGHR
jgi:glutamate--cysteine ligase